MANKQILLVEDNHDDEELTCLALRNCTVPNDTFVVGDGEEALKYLNIIDSSSNNENRRLPDLILLDLKLPKVSGLEVLEKVRNNPRTRLIPVVVLTSSSEINDILSSYLIGANSYLRKPVEFSQFREMLNVLGNYWLVFNQNPPNSF